MQAMVEQLLHLARLDTGPSMFETSGYDPAELALEAWEPFARQALSRELRVDLSFEDGLRVTLNRELLALVLRNLNDNAVTYAEPKGRVHITLRRTTQHEMCFEVSNSGSRLDQEQASAAIRRFWRGDPARAETGLHCGLGLALVEKATRVLGGSLRLSSQVDGDFVAQVLLPVDGSA
jgi:two-component system heavy metal sensor histidine kinase CusS